jgi:hypothetical protein
MGESGGNRRRKVPMTDQNITLTMSKADAEVG